MSTSTHTPTDRAAWLDTAARDALRAHLQRTGASSEAREEAATLPIATVLLRLPRAMRSILAAASLLHYGELVHPGLAEPEPTHWRAPRRTTSANHRRAGKVAACGPDR
ncbi:hypothetical protein ABQZ69_03715 [Xanthomonas sp. WHRI 8391]|uniref:hypothetical protein n=1 Tax=Xanthomonas TaxID=338 RepID=UPI001A34C3BF|nr:hypothetical protein [Xanthomonas hortorum]MBG3850072.1 hypothetical protein [Xanthomonas hortorum pv. carotae]UTS72708.1 hypothetical protein NMB96_20100 [Xanthomonas hortorum]